MHPLRALVAFAALAAASCESARERRFQFDDPALQALVGQIRANCQQADLIFVGSVEALGPAPRAWSGTFRHVQPVRYRVTSVFKGSYLDPEIVVDHTLVEGSRLAGAAVGLQPALFAAGREVIVFARRAAPFGYDDFDEDVGVIPASKQNRRALERLY